jgi:hypothetical protein
MWFSSQQLVSHIQPVKLKPEPRHMASNNFIFLRIMCVIPRYMYHKPFMGKFPNKSEWQNGFNPDNKEV